MKIKLLVKKIKYKVIKFLYEYFKKIYIRNINIADNKILQYAHNEEIASDNWIMAVDINDLDLTYLSLTYDIQWKNCFCMKDICLKDVTPELEKRLLKKLKIINNK